MSEEKSVKEKESFVEAEFKADNVCSYIPFGPIKQTKLRKLSLNNQLDLNQVTEDIGDAYNLGNDFICSICKNLIIKATRLPCNHLFCYYCIHKSIRLKPRCPLCRALISSYLTDEKADEAIHELLECHPEQKIIRDSLIETRACDPEIQHLNLGNSTGEFFNEEKKPTDFESRTSIFNNANLSEDDSESSFTLDSSNLEFSDNSSGSDDIEDLEIDRLSGDRAVCINLKPRCRK